VVPNGFRVQGRASTIAPSAASHECAWRVPWNELLGVSPVQTGLMGDISDREDG
jgi:hypothetical protein